MDPLKEPRKGTLIDPFKGNAGLISSTVGFRFWGVFSLGRVTAPFLWVGTRITCTLTTVAEGRVLVAWSLEFTFYLRNYMRK